MPFQYSNTQQHRYNPRGTANYPPYIGMAVAALSRRAAHSALPYSWRTAAKLTAWVGVAVLCRGRCNGANWQEELVANRGLIGEPAKRANPPKIYLV